MAVKLGGDFSQSLEKELADDPVWKKLDVDLLLNPEAQNLEKKFIHDSKKLAE
jgi:hypothetical protein